jgi:hypothetical protein
VDGEKMKLENGKINIFKIDAKDSLIKVDQQTPWMLELLEELHEDIDKDDPFFENFQSSITFQGELARKDKGQMGDLGILKGELTVDFCTYDVNTGEMMSESLECPVNAVFMDQKVCTELGYEDETNLLVDTVEYDLYFYDGKTIDVKEVLHEYIYLNKDPYPRKDA